VDRWIRSLGQGGEASQHRADHGRREDGGYRGGGCEEQLAGRGEGGSLEASKMAMYIGIGDTSLIRIKPNLLQLRVRQTTLLSKQQEYLKGMLK
jgi:hypothetical protein